MKKNVSEKKKYFFSEIKKIIFFIKIILQMQKLFCKKNIFFFIRWFECMNAMNGMNACHHEDASCSCIMLLYVYKHIGGRQRGRASRITIIMWMQIMLMKKSWHDFYFIKNKIFVSEKKYFFFWSKKIIFL